MAFAQLTYRESLRDIETVCERSAASSITWGSKYIARSTLADANESRTGDLCGFAQVLLLSHDRCMLMIPSVWNCIKVCTALDSTPSIFVSRCFWARFRQHKAAVKSTTLLDLHGNIPTFIRITDGQVHDVNVLDEILPEAGAFYVLDRGYIDFERLFVFTLCSRFFVVTHQREHLAAAAPTLTRWTKRQVCDRITTVILTAFESAKAYPDPLRRVCYLDIETNKHSIPDQQLRASSTDHCPDLQVPWQVELLLNGSAALTIKSFYGTSENAVKTQFGSPSRFMCCGHRPQTSCLGESLYQILQILSITILEKCPFYRRSKHSTPNRTYSITLTSSFFSTSNRQE